ncbi:serine/threonine-protein kinase [Polyangium sp. 15x6]|uniref:serine/threonine-protein kinase n=1 Tax=Polyangium sp. 15x6 TaxID=3042687 RepID=UPI00249C7ED9|nr:serine/threonine-protein kinase [Polyangium sp. 15x6]MDI3282803.1 serine/threonine-protein kinase [Polyangium sp. 15x6]
MKSAEYAIDVDVDLGEASLPRQGDVVAGKYRVLRALGAGGMGVVVEAEHTSLRQRVALKFLHPKVAASDVSVTRLLREARAASAIKSEHVARVLDMGTLPWGSPFVVMEYLTGIDLRGMLGRRGPLPVEDAVDYILQACEALAEAHSLGIVHRDIKPSNLFLTSRADGSPLIKVLDFGIAKVLRPSGATQAEDVVTLTGNGLVVGSPRYTSPERLRDPTHVDPRTDIWSLGIVLHELLTGQSPFEAKTISSLYFRIAADPPARVRDVRPDVPEGLENAILQCLQKDPSKRTPDVAELAASLRPFAPERSETSVRRAIRVLGITPEKLSTYAGWTGSREADGPRGSLSTALLPAALRRSARIRAGLGLLGVTLLVVGALVVSSGDAPEEIAPAPGQAHGAPERRNEPSVEVAPADRSAPTAEGPDEPAAPASSSAAKEQKGGTTSPYRTSGAPAGRRKGGSFLDPLGSRK